MKNIFTIILLLTVLKGYSQEADTAEIYFDYNVARFSDASSRRLDSFRFARILVPGHKTTVYGYTDFKGSDDYNKQLSIARAKNVKNYLVSLGLDERDIVHCEGKGKARTDQEEDKDRKVLIIMERAPSKYAKARAAAEAKETAMVNSAPTPPKPTKTKSPKNGDVNPSDSAATAVKTIKTAKTKTPKTGTLSATDSAATAAKTTKSKTPKTGTLSPADSAAMAAKKASRDSAALAAKKAKKASDDAAMAAKKASADSAAMAMKAAKKASADAAMAAKAAKKASADSAALAAKAAKKAAADSAAMVAKMAKNTPKTGSTNPSDSAGMTRNTKPKNPKTGTHTSSDSTAKVAKAKNPRSDGSKPATETKTGTTGNTVADGTAPVQVVLGDNMGSTSPTPAGTATATSGTPPPAAAGTIVRPKLPAPEPIVPLKKDANIARHTEKNIATLDPKKLIIGEIIPLNNIYFAPASNEMLRQSEPSLELLFKFLKTNTNLAVEIQGRICCLSPLDGTDEPDGAGSTRSTARAKNIYDYLVNKGIDKNRISYSGLGNTKPSVYPEKTEFDRDLNRRATMKIIYK